LPCDSSMHVLFVLTAAVRAREAAERVLQEEETQRQAEALAAVQRLADVDVAQWSVEHMCDVWLGCFMDFPQYVDGFKAKRARGKVLKHLCDGATLKKMGVDDEDDRCRLLAALEAERLGDDDGVGSWTVQHVCTTWLGVLELSPLSDVFKAHRINGNRLLVLSVEKLEEMGVDMVLDGPQILSAVAELTAPPVPGLFRGKYTLDKTTPAKRGGTSTVQFATFGNMPCVVKWFGERGAFEREKALLLLHLPVVVELMDAYDDEGEAGCVVLKRGIISLEDALQAEVGWLQKLTWLCYLVKCLDHLHCSGRVHGDVKPTNFMRFGDVVDWRLIDLEGAFGVGERMTPLRVTMRFAAPELAAAAAAAACSDQQYGPPTAKTKTQKNHI